MKTNSRRLAGIIILASALTRLDAAESPISVEAEIRSASVLYQQLVWVANEPPSEKENQLLASDIRDIKEHGLGSGLAALENFVATRANSPWTPSLQANLGQYYLEHGRYSEAIQNWEAAWAATRAATDGAAKQVADSIFVNCGRLLVGLGKVDELKQLLQESEGRSFGRGSMIQTARQIRSDYNAMSSDGDISFRCGLYAVNSLGNKLKKGAFDRSVMLRFPAPSTGFSLAKLAAMAQGAGIDLEAVQWNEDKALPVPSVVHWKDKHYAAILSERNGLYEVDDSVFGLHRWLSADDIRKEASGYFLKPKNALQSQWRLLDDSESSQIFGRGFINTIRDPDDGCPSSPPPRLPPPSPPSPPPAPPKTPNSPKKAGADIDWSNTGDKCTGCNGVPGSSGGSNGGSVGGSNGGSTGGSGSGCSSNCPSGMAVWEVSEPQINLWLYDEPIAYQSALGGKVSFKLSYKQRDIDPTIPVPPPGAVRTINPNYFSVGTNWHCSWLSYVKDDAAGNTEYVMLPSGAWRTYYPNSGNPPELYSGGTMQRLVDGSGNLTGFIISYGNGAKEYYGFVPHETPDGFPGTNALLTATVDPYNHTNQFIYLEANGKVYLQQMIDADGKTNTLGYTNPNYPTQITGVTNPYGYSTTLQYGQYGLLTNIVDEIGMKSSFLYDDQFWITNLTTPYGTTTFQNATNVDDYLGPNGDYRTLIRAIRVVDAAGGTNVYMLRNDSSGVMINGTLFNFIDVNSYASVTPNPVPACIDYGTINYRDSFHWGPLQASALPANMWAYMPSNLICATMSHWFHDGSGSAEISQTLGMRQSPSPDGKNPGQTTWYGYAEWNDVRFTCSDEKILPQGGPQESQPYLMARILPDGSTQFTCYQRDQFGHATNVVDTYSSSYGATPQTRTNVYIYDNNSINLVQHIGALGETNCFVYDTTNQLVYITNAVGEVTAYKYDSQGRCTSMTQPSGLVTTNTYYASGPNVNFLNTTMDLQIGRTNSYTYTNGLVYTHMDERGLTTTNTWDALQRLVQVGYPDGSFVTNSYNRLDLVQVQDRMGFKTSYVYDNVRRMTAMTNALGNPTLYGYCTCGALESIQDAAGNVTSFTYDNAGHRLSVRYPDLYSISYNYDLMGRVTNTIDIGGVSATNWYNNQGLVYAVSNAVGQTSLLSFDAEDRVTNTVDANDVSIGIAYDSLGRVHTRSYPDLGVESFGYTFGIRSPTSYTNQITNATFYAYDLAGRKIAETNALNYVTAFSNAPAGDLLALMDGNGNTTKWSYDAYGRVTNKVDAAGNQLFAYKYDPDNRLTNRWSIAKANTAYAYDAVGNLTKITYPVSPSITLSYDVLNRLANMVDAVGSTVYGYDSVGELLSEDGPWPSDTVNYKYQNRLRTALSVQTPNGPSWTQSYGYDLARRLKATASAAGTFNYLYDPVELQRVDELTLPNGAYITNTFDNVARLKGTWLLNSSGSNLDSYVYAYNQASQRTNVVRTARDHIAYAYDAIGELASAVAYEPSGTIRAAEQLSYAYDAGGNLLQKQTSAILAGQVAYSMNSLNEITNGLQGTWSVGSGWSASIPVAGSTTSPATNVTINGSSVSTNGDNTFAQYETVNAGSNGFTVVAKDVYGRICTSTTSVNVVPTNNAYAYDLNGNLLTDGTRCFAYDDENQLISVWKTNGWRNDFVYDGKMRRRIEMDYIWNGSAWAQTNEILFIYDGNLALQERNGNNQPQVTYTRGNDLSGMLQGGGGIGGLLARSDAAAVAPWTVPFGVASSQFGTHSYYHGDGNGNVTALLSASQMVVAKYLYDPYGNTLAKWGLLADVNNYRFSSKEWNANAGLYYYLYRFFDPNLQRWLNRDPREESSGVSLYEYNEDDPDDFIDPDGAAPTSKPSADPCAKELQYFKRATADAAVACGATIVCIEGGPIDLIPGAACVWTQLRALEAENEWLNCKNDHKPHPKPPTPKPPTPKPPKK